MTRESEYDPHELTKAEKLAMGGSNTLHYDDDISSFIWGDKEEENIIGVLNFNGTEMRYVPSTGVFLNTLEMYYVLKVMRAKQKEYKDEENVCDTPQASAESE